MKNLKNNLCELIQYHIKGSPDQSHFMSEINVGKRRIRQRTDPKLNDLIFTRFWVDQEIQFQSRSMSNPPISDIDFKINWLGSELPLTLVNFWENLQFCESRKTLESGWKGHGKGLFGMRTHSNLFQICVFLFLSSLVWSEMYW